MNKWNVPFESRFMNVVEGNYDFLHVFREKYEAEISSRLGGTKSN